jgi:hypothetical protein
MRNLHTGFLAVVCVGLISCISSAGEQPDRQKPDATAPCEQIVLAPLRQEREQALQELMRQRNETVNCLLSNFAKLSQKPDKSFGGSFHLTVAALGAWRVEEAGGQVVPFIDFQLDMTNLPVGFSYGPAFAYPVARALKEIGGQRVVDDIFRSLTFQPANDGVLRASAWVLSEVLGRDIVQMIVQQKLNRLTTTLFNIAEAKPRSREEAQEMAKQLLEHNPEGHNLEKLAQLLLGKEPLLP